MLSKYPVLRLITKFIIPFIVFFGIYIQINGEMSPGGGFQAGAIFASLIIAFSFVSGKTLYSYALLRLLSSAGLLIYAVTGLAPTVIGYKYSDYYALAKDPHTAQKFGIFMIELGVGITVAAGMLLIYFIFDEDQL